MRNAVVIIVLGSSLAVSSTPGIASKQGEASPVPVSRREAEEWIRWVIPLPKQVTIRRKIELKPSEVTVRLLGQPGDAVEQALSQLVWKLPKGGGPSARPFEILVGRCDARGRLGEWALPAATRLVRMPNHEQAYCISPMGKRRLVVTALDDRGLFYGLTTLRLLLAPRASGDRVAIPLAEILDAPDLAERGRWGSFVKEDFEWMSSMKMNLVEMHVPYQYSKDGNSVATLPLELIELARRNAIKFVPIITHMDQMGGRGIYEAHPELLRDVKPGEAGAQAPDPSNPVLVEVLADWMMTLAAHPAISEISCWLSEHHNIGSADQYVGEVRAYIKALQLARRKYPKLRIRILLSQGSYPTNDRILAEVPQDLGVTFYSGTHTYTSTRDPIIYPLLADYAAKGRWLGCYPQGTVAWLLICPWSGPNFIRARSSEFFEKKLQSVAWYMVPNARIYPMNFTGAAEWGWNADGRNVKEFSAAWATREGFQDPESLADWVETLGPVSWDVYGSSVPFLWCWQGIENILDGQVAPQLGTHFFRYWKTLDDFDKDVARAQEALALAKRMDAPALIDETLIVQGYVKMTKEIYLATTALRKEPPPSPAEKAEWGEILARLAQASQQTTSALRDWAKAVDLKDTSDKRFEVFTVGTTEKAVRTIAEAMAAHGVKGNVEQ